VRGGRRGKGKEGYEREEKGGKGEGGVGRGVEERGGRKGREERELVPIFQNVAASLHIAGVTAFL